jgi:type II secretory pathway pseudopilin PulG
MVSHGLTESVSNRGQRLTRLWPARTRTCGAFSLIELLLVTSLVMLLAGALVFSFSNLIRGTQLEEGTGRVETLIHFARAQAANTGKKVQLVFGQESGSSSNVTNSAIRLTWEPDPLGQPGRFENLSLCESDGICDLVQVKQVQLFGPGQSITSTITPLAPPDSRTNSTPSEALSSITFYPDGTCDSAEIILSSTEPDNEQRMSVRVAGISGSTTHRLMPTDEDEVSEDSTTVETNPVKPE